MTTNTNQDLVRIANERWAHIAPRINAHPYTCEWIGGMCLHVGELLEKNTEALWDDDGADTALQNADQILGEVADALRIAAVASKSDDANLRLVAALALGADGNCVASHADPDGSLLIATTTSYGSSIVSEIMPTLDGELVYHNTRNDAGATLALFHIPAARVGDWEQQRERVLAGCRR